MRSLLAPPVAALNARQVARFTAMVALLAIFTDAAVGHALLWENDPYWTYWITKIFLIATIFGLGTAWLGIGVGRGALITAVHTVVLTVYYWSLSPIGLPSSPEWLDLEHTWVSGVPVHFGVIFLGYLVALWLWRREAARTDDERASGRAWSALLSALAIVVVSGGLASLVLGDFPGVTWFLVRLLVTVPFLLWWWGWAGRNRTAAVVGGVVLAFVWATYSHYLGPVGLPDTPLRILDPSPPPATVEWLDYQQLWLVSFPIYLVTMVGVLLLESSWGERARATFGATAVLVVAGSLLAVGAAGQHTLGQRGAQVSLSAAGTVEVETGPFYSDVFEQGTGELRLDAEDFGARVTPLPPHDELRLTATVSSGGMEVSVAVDQAMVNHPLGEHTTWWGVGLDVEHHGHSGIGTDRLPAIASAVAAFGLGEVSLDGQVIATGVPVHVMTAEDGLPAGARLEMDVGMEDQDVPGLPAGHLRVLWTDYQAQIEDPHPLRYAIGISVLLVLLVSMVWLLRREPAR